MAEEADKLKQEANKLFKGLCKLIDVRSSRLRGDGCLMGSRGCAQLICPDKAGS
jgi:hypothetical protein